MNKREWLKRMPVPPALVTDLQRLDSRLTDASWRLKKANDELYLAERAHREAAEAVDVELARLENSGAGEPK